MNLRTLSAITAVALLTGCDEDKPMAPGPQPPATSEEFVQVLATVYRTQDYATFSVLLADDFTFILDMPNPDTGETEWDAATERRIHSRMFNPESIPANDPPLATEFWLQTVTITLTPENAFTERLDLYTTAMPPGPFDPTRWIARSSYYGTDVFFQLQGDTDFQITGRAYFTILEDRTRQVGDAGKFLIVHWEDLGMSRLAVEEKTWSGVKGIYK
jgi:hypothetical protein